MSDMEANELDYLPEALAEIERLKHMLKHSGLAGAELAQGMNAVAGLAHVAEDRVAELEAEYGPLLSRQAATLTATANALRGTPPPLTHWSHHDVADVAATVVGERDESQAEVERLRAIVGSVRALADRWDEADGNGLDSAVQSIKVATAVAHLRAAISEAAQVGSGARPQTKVGRQMFEAGRRHRCRNQEGCCEDCETHLGCRCGDHDPSPVDL